MPPRMTPNAEKNSQLPGPDFFGDGSPFLSHPLLTAERTKREIDFLMASFQLPPDAHWLDLGCGFGRHAVELARRGGRVVGVDASPAMIAAARKKAAEADVSPVFQIGLAEAFATDTLFDAAIVLFTSLGQFTGSGENSRLLERAADALKKGGRLAIEVPQRAAALAQLKPSERFGNQPHFTVVTRTYQPADHSITERFEVIGPQATSTFTLHYRLYSHGELIALLKNAGFANIVSYGAYDGTPLQDSHPNMVVLAEKGGME